MYFKFKINARDIGGGIKIDRCDFQKTTFWCKIRFLIFFNRFLTCFTCVQPYCDLVTWPNIHNLNKERRTRNTFILLSSCYLIHPGHFGINVFFSYLYFFLFPYLSNYFMTTCVTFYPVEVGYGDGGGGGGVNLLQPRRTPSSCT